MEPLSIMQWVCVHYYIIITHYYIIINKGSIIAYYYDYRFQTDEVADAGSTLRVIAAKNHSLSVCQATSIWS